MKYILILLLKLNINLSQIIIQKGTIVSSGLSKWCGAGGWRLGFFALPKELKELKNSLKILCSESFTSVSAPIQYAAVEAYTGNYSSYLEESKKNIILLQACMFMKI